VKTKEVYNTWSYTLTFPFISMAVAWLGIYSPGNLMFVLLFQQTLTLPDWRTNGLLSLNGNEKKYNSNGVWNKKNTRRK